MLIISIRFFFYIQCLAICNEFLTILILYECNVWMWSIVKMNFKKNCRIISIICLICTSFSKKMSSSNMANCGWFWTVLFDLVCLCWFTLFEKTENNRNISTHYVLYLPLRLECKQVNKNIRYRWGSYKVKCLWTVRETYKWPHTKNH